MILGGLFDLPWKKILSNIIDILTIIFVMYILPVALFDFILGEFILNPCLYPTPVRCVLGAYWVILTFLSVYKIKEVNNG